MAHIKIKNICKSYGSVEVMKDCNLEFRDGEFIVLVGPSGCGKTTLLRMIAGLERITSGDLLIDGQRVNDLPPRDRDIAMVFQSYALYPHMDVARNMGFSLEIRREKQSEKTSRVRMAAETLGLTSYLERLPRALSGGQRQRVAMGRTIVRDPRVFLFDEPLSNLDAALRVEMRLEIAKLHQRLGASMVYVTHDQVEALTLADRIVVLNHGVVQQVGTPLELYQTPANLFVAKFIGSPTMNVVQVTPNTNALLMPNGIRLNNPDLPASPQARHIGIRPEHISLCEPENAHAQGTAEVVERLGSESYIYCNISKIGRILLRVAGNTAVKSGEVVALRFDLSEAHVFDDREMALPRVPLAAAS